MKFPLVLIFTLLLSSLNAQVIINEFSASNLNQFKDNYGKTEDWVELYNAGSQDVDISGWYLSDKSKNKTKWQFPQNTIIEAESFLVVLCSGRDEVFGTDIHTNFKLSQTTGKDKIVISDSQGNVLEQHELDLTLVENSRCRKFDGSISWRICTNPTPGSSNNNATTYEGYTSTPEIEQSAGFYQDSVWVSIRNNEVDAVVRYTLDGSGVTEDSPVYQQPIRIDETKVVKARAFSNDPMILPGKMDFSTFFINEDFSVAVFSVASEEVIELANGDGQKIPIGSIEYFNLDREREATSYGSLNRHGQDSWALPHRSLDWISRDEMGYSKEVKARLFSYSDRDEYQRFMFRNSGDDNYPAIDDFAHHGSTHIRDEYVQTLALEGNMRLDTRAVERVVLFLNGRYWGLYGMRERPVDHDYTEYYYDQDKYNLHFLSTWGSTEAEYGGIDALKEWYDVRDFILENDMSLQENFDSIAKEIDLLSFIDYFIVNLNVVAKDWLNYNTAWWKGLDPEGGHKKWGYVLWDLDATFDYYINYTGIPNQDSDAEPCDMEHIANSMDNFFGNIGDPANCNTIEDGTCPYPPEDPVFIEVIFQDSYCCNNQWDNVCQDLYDQINETITLIEAGCNSIANGSSPYTADDPIFFKTIQAQPSCCEDEWTPECELLYKEIKVQVGQDELFGNIGKHEKMLLKLLDESPPFRQLYYSRHTDMMNTVFSCENMNETLNKMLEVIEPEMPRQIERWGGTIEEWMDNVEQLKRFVNERCLYLDDGMVSCFDLTGPFDLTILTDPPHMADIKLNTIFLEELPWSGSYFGGMQNSLECNLKSEFEPEYSFSHWESTSTNTFFEDAYKINTHFELYESDTLIANFKLATDVHDLMENPGFSVFPNPSSTQVVIDVTRISDDIKSMDILTLNGQKIMDLNHILSNAPKNLSYKINLSELSLPAGVYQIIIRTQNEVYTERIVKL